MNIPINILDSMYKEKEGLNTVVKPQPGINITEKIVNQKAMKLAEELQNRQPQSPIPKAPESQSPKFVAVDGFVFPGDMSTCLIYVIIKAFGKDKKMQKIFKEFDFKLKDLNGKQVYPPLKKKK